MVPRRPLSEGYRIPGVPASRLDRITSDPQICHGQPVVRGLRIPGRVLRSAPTHQDIGRDHAQCAQLLQAGDRPVDRLLLDPGVAECGVQQIVIRSLQRVQYIRLERYSALGVHER
ncbi:hypothetical protein B0T44_08760 [Nocardia donostiensis]|uniref:Uncharacterized protein n=1 Tax=Nocardia donostiensis TaxID=1538463 RepID=A0A1W0BEZ6_9NOCA|nr:hypothetical protein B0T46_18830 [Nocardia donostiensis]OQS21099.1 hypothetical protein B0T44_08760 [Nocardia donostiensis]